MTIAWHDLQHEPITWEMFLDIDEDVRRDLEIVDGYAVPREQREQLAAEHVLVAAEVLSTWSGRRDRVHKMSDYADAGIPHYWLVSFDKVGAVTIERYALAGGAGRYVHVGTSHPDMGPTAVNISAPFPVEILWADLEVAPRVLVHLSVGSSGVVPGCLRAPRVGASDSPCCRRCRRGLGRAGAGRVPAGCGP
jgi:Putative restriction endonuclease